MASLLKEIFKINWNSSVYLLILANLITIAFALIKNWDFSILLLIYWCQGAIIVLFTCIKVYKLNKNNFSETLFFIFLFITTYILYLGVIFINLGTKFTLSIFIILCILSFFVNHLFSFKKNFESDAKKKRTIKQYANLAFLRIAPMHIIVLPILSFTNKTLLVIFLILKIIVDVVSHNYEHKI